MGRANDTIQLTEKTTTVAGLIKHLSETDSAFNQLNQSENPPLISVNQIFAEVTSTLQSGDEVGFFPPMTGG